MVTSYRRDTGIRGGSPERPRSVGLESRECEKGSLAPLVILYRLFLTSIINAYPFKHRQNTLRLLLPVNLEGYTPDLKHLESVP